MRKRVCLAAGGSLLAATISLFGAAASASAGTASPVVGFTYVNDNTAVANTVAGFDRHADGSLTPIPGSPFAAGGAGLGTGLASQGAIQATPDGRFLLAVDAGSNQISVLRVAAHGVPKPVGPPVSSGGVEPVSIAISRSGLVYVANAGNGGSNNYTGFRLHSNGTLTPIPHSTVPVPDGSGVADVFFNATGNHLVGTRVNTSLIDSFVVLPGGRLLAAHGSPFTAQGLGQIGAEFSPARPSLLFVSNAHNGAGLGTVSAFRDSFLGRLSPVGSSPYADGQTAPCWVEITHNGRYLFTVNTGSGNISSYSINPDGSLVLLGTAPITSGAGSTDARLSPDGRTLSVVGAGNDVVHVFAVSGGSLTELPSSGAPLPAGSSPAGIVVL
ncbi:MAG TPA: beta-propeller fold lactonase family protein [Streptosporangiaceae bacterium]|jgi:6-phosphogluconolactonase (cycloisomerase 2 family)